MQRGLVFQCDDKYANYLEELQARGWVRDTSGDSNADLALLSMPIPSSCNFICKNLSKLRFATVFDRHVNHLRGSQHLSNKAFLTYHLKASDCANVLPPTWSSACDDVAHLIVLLAINEAYSIATAVLQAVVDESYVQRTVILRRVCAALRPSGGLVDGARQDVSRSLAHMAATLYAAVIDSRAGEAGSSISAEITQSMRAMQRMCADTGLCDPHSDRNMWLIKAVGMSCGNSIYIKNRIADIIDVVSKEMNFKCVVQKYIERPLLVRGEFKFDIRQWALVTSANPMVIYGFSQCYLRLSSRPFSLEDSGLGNKLVHLTNNAIQRTAAPLETSIAVDSSSGSPLIMSQIYGEIFDHPLMMSQTEFSRELENQRDKHTTKDLLGAENTVFDSCIKKQMKEITVSSITAVRDRLEKVGRGYEWLGLDFMVTEDLTVKLLEINTSPDMTYSTPITEWLVKAATADLMDLILNEELTAPANIKRTRGLRETVSTSVPSRPMWEHWHCAAVETKAQIQSFSSKKMDTLGPLDTEHGLKGAAAADFFSQVLTSLASAAETGEVVDEMVANGAVVGQFDEDDDDDEL